MKTTKNINNLLILILIFFSFSCTEILTQGTRVRVLCDDLSDKETLRAKAMGEASIYTIAERKSAAIARDELGKSVLNSIQSTTDLEFQQIMKQLEEELSVGVDLEMVIREECNAIISGSVITCQKVRKSKDGMYYVYTNIEINRSEAMKQAKNLLSIR